MHIETHASHPLDYDPMESDHLRWMDCSNSRSLRLSTPLTCSSNHAKYAPYPTAFMELHVSSCKHIREFVFHVSFRVDCSCYFFRLLLFFPWMSRDGVGPRSSRCPSLVCSRRTRRVGAPHFRDVASLRTAFDGHGRRWRRTQLRAEGLGRRAGGPNLDRQQSEAGLPLRIHPIHHRRRHEHRTETYVVAAAWTHVKPLHGAGSDGWTETCDGEWSTCNRQAVVSTQGGRGDEPASRDRTHPTDSGTKKVCGRGSNHAFRCTDVDVRFLVAYKQPSRKTGFPGGEQQW